MAQVARFIARTEQQVAFELSLCSDKREVRRDSCQWGHGMRVLGSWSFWVFLTAIVTAAILPMFPSGYTRLIGWAVVAGAVLAVVWTISQSNSRTLVFLVDERNRYELTQLITLAWFVVIVSAFLACALWNIQLWDGRDPRLPIAINVPATVWSKVPVRLPLFKPTGPVSPTVPLAYCTVPLRLPESSIVPAGRGAGSAREVTREGDSWIPYIPERRA